ncbi:MAG: hypothetical protein ACOYLH_07075 [Flavobacteriales bacterium]
MTERYAQVMRSELTLPDDSLEILGKELTAEGLAGAAQQLIVFTGKPMASVQQDITQLKGFSMDSVATTFDYTISNEWLAKAKSIKKMSLKMAYIDSILNAHSETASFPQLYFFLSKNPFAIKKWKGPLLNKIEEIGTSKNVISTLHEYAALHQSAKWIKDAKAMGIVKGKVNLLLETLPAKELSFFQEVIKIPVKKATAAPQIIPETKAQQPAIKNYLGLIIGISILTIVFLILFLTKSHQLKKTKHELFNFQYKESKSRNELSERENALVLANQDLIRENKSVLEELKNRQKTINHFEDQINVFNTELKQAIDNLSKEHSVQHALEANNALTRNIARMKELLNSQH